MTITHDGDSVTWGPTDIDNTDSPYTTQGESHIYVDTSSAAVTVTLASADAVDGREIRIVDTGGNAAANAITVNTEGSETLNPGGASSFTLDVDGDYVDLFSDGSNWFTDRNKTLEAVRVGTDTVTDLTGTNLSVTSGTLDASGGAPTDATYLTQAVESGLSAERILAVGTGLGLTDGGAGNNLTVDADTLRGEAFVTTAAASSLTSETVANQLTDVYGAPITTGAKLTLTADVEDDAGTPNTLIDESVPAWAAQVGLSATPVASHLSSIANNGSAISVGDTLSPDAASTHDLGSSSNPWRGVFSDAVTWNVSSINDTDSPYTTSGESVIYVDTSSAAVTVTLATADAVDGREVRIVDTGGNAATNAITVNTEGAETLNPGGASSFTLDVDGDYVDLFSDGSNWFTDRNRSAETFSTDSLVFAGTLTEDGTIDVTGATSTTYNLTTTYDVVYVRILNLDENGTDTPDLELQWNGDTGSNYDYNDTAGNATTGATAVDWGSTIDEAPREFRLWHSPTTGKTLYAAMNTTIFTNGGVAARNGNIDAAFSSITIQDQGDTEAFDLQAHVYGGDF